MPGFLDEVLAAVRDDLAAGRYRLASSTDGRTPPSLARAIERERDRGALVAEFKRVSPGAASPELPTRDVGDFLARVPANAVAGYSCLATRHRFRGSVDDVARLSVETSAPVLFKDFVVDLAQIDAAARAGAAAVLLLARLEAERRLRTPLSALARAARDRGLEVVLELHRPEEFKTVETVRPDVWGVNVRDLDNLRIEREVVGATFRQLDDVAEPVLGLSGVEGREEAIAFYEAGADGILVGSALARSTDPARFLDGLRRPPGGQRP